MNKITIFQSLTTPKKPFYISDFKAFERIRTGKSRELIEKIRSCKTKEEREKYKSELTCICFSGTFKTRKDSDLINHSGLVCLDFDNIDNPETLKEELKNDDFVYASFISPSGNGLKVIVKIPAKKEDHRSHFRALGEHYNIDGFDESSVNESRVCFESYDPDIYININSRIFDKKHDPEILDRSDSGDYEEVPITDVKEIIDRLVIWMERKYGPYNHSQKGDDHPAGGRHNWIIRFAAACNSYGVPYHECYNYLQTLGDFSQKEMDGSLGWAYKQVGEFNKKYFVNKKAKNAARSMARGGKKKEEIRNFLIEIENVTPKIADKVISEIQSEMNNKDESFWDAVPTKDGVKIVFNRYKWINWIQSPPQSVSRYKSSVEDWDLIQAIEGKRIRVIQQDDLTQINFRYIESLPENIDHTTKYQIWEQMAKGINSYFSKSIQSIMPPFHHPFQRDDKETAYFYFQNSAVKVTPEKIQLASYNEIENYIWDTHVIDDYEIKLQDNIENDYKRFIELVCKEDDDRYHAMISTIGYMLHSHKDRLNSKMVFLYDESISDNPEGGTGKGVLVLGLEQMKRVVSLDGKILDLKKDFALQRVSPDTQIVCIQDLSENFDFTLMFNMITDGIQINRKNKDEIYIPYEYSPKFIATTNNVPKGIGNSHERRKIELELSQYFNKYHTPQDEFKRALFFDWTADDRQRFHNFMLHCTQYYLKNGVLTPKLVNLTKRKFAANTSPEFVEWCINIQMNHTIERSVLRGNFLKAYPEKERYVSTLKFNKFIEAFGRQFKVKIKTSRSGNDFFYTFEDTEGLFAEYVKEVKNNLWTRKNDFDDVPF